MATALKDIIKFQAAFYYTRNYFGPQWASNDVFRTRILILKWCHNTGTGTVTSLLLQYIVLQKFSCSVLLQTLECICNLLFEYLLELNECLHVLLLIGLFKYSFWLFNLQIPQFHPLISWPYNGLGILLIAFRVGFVQSVVLGPGRVWEGV